MLFMQFIFQIPVAGHASVSAEPFSQGVVLLLIETSEIMVLTLFMLLPLFSWFLHYACARKAAGAAWQEGGI